MAYTLLRVVGPDGTEEINLNRERITIGRSSESDLVLNEKKASRKHCVIEITGAGWKVTDLESGNGTEVNGVDVPSQILKHDDIIRIGEHTLRLIIVTDALSTAPSPPPTTPVTPPAPAAQKMRESQDETERIQVKRRRRINVSAAAGGGIAAAIAGAIGLVVLAIMASGGGSNDDSTARKKDDGVIYMPYAGTTPPSEPSSKRVEPKRRDPVKETNPSDFNIPRYDAPPPLESSDFAPPPRESGKPDEDFKIPSPAAGPREGPKTTLGRLTALVIEAVEKKTIQSPYVPVGKEQWQICGGTIETVKLARWGKIDEVRWDSMPPDGLYKAFKALGTKPDVRLLRAEYALEKGLVEEAFDELAALAKEKSDAKPQIDEMLARAFGESVPPGGYTYVSGDWMSEADRRAFEAKAKVASLLAQITSLPQFDEARRTVKKDLRVLQRKAVLLIQSEQDYPEHGEGKAEGQRKVDELVEQIREIWLRAYEYVKRKHPDWNAGFRQVLDQLIAKAVGADAPVDPADLEVRIAKAFDLREWPLDGQDKSIIEHNRKIADYHRRLWTVANADEMELLARINEYRWQLGLHAGVMDEMLMLAGRHHSNEMARLGYFSHTSPVNKRSGPGERAGEEGTSGGSENISRGGSVPSAFDGWYGSPPHHRNMIGGGVLGQGGCDGYATLQVRGSPGEMPPSQKEMLRPAWLLDMRLYPVGHESAGKGASARRQYVRARLDVIRWLRTGEDLDAVRRFRASAETWLPFILADLKAAQGVWAAVLLDIVGALKARDGISAALASLDNVDPWVRFVAAETCGKFAGITEAPTATVRAGETVAEGAALAEPAAKRIARRLVEQLTREGHEAVNAAVMAALAEIGWPEGLAALRQIRASAGSWRYRYWATKAWTKSKSGKGEIALSLNDERRAVREIAASLLGFDQNPDFDKLVQESSGKRGEYLLVYYAREPQWLVVANALVGNQNAEVRMHAACGLGRMPRKEVWQVLIKAATESSPFETKLFSWRSAMDVDAGQTRPLLEQAAAATGDKEKRARLEELIR